MKKLICFLTTLRGFLLLSQKKYLDIGESFIYCEDLKAIFYNKRIIAENVEGYKKVDDGIFVKTADSVHFFSNFGQEVVYKQFLFGYEVTWSEKSIKYYTLLGLERDIAFASLLIKYNNPKDLKKVYENGYSIYRIGSINYLLNENIEIILSKNCRLVRNGDIITYKSEKSGMFFEAYSLSLNGKVETIDIKDLENTCSYLIPLTEKIEKDISRFVDFQAISVNEIEGYKIYKWSFDSDYEIYDRNMNFIDGIKGGHMELFPQGYLKIRKDESLFMNFNKEVVLKSPWNINVHNGVLSILQNHGGRFFYEIYSIKDGLYIGKILTGFSGGMPETIDNVKACEIIDTEQGVTFNLQDGRIMKYNSQGIKY